MGHNKPLPSTYASILDAYYFDATLTVLIANLASSRDLLRAYRSIDPLIDATAQ